MPFDWDVSSPADSSFIADYPANERSQRTAALGSVDADHYAETTGLHRRVSMVPLGADPTLVALNGFLYTKTVSGRTELFYQDDNGNVVQLTTVGASAPDKVSKAGDTMTGKLTISAGGLELGADDILLANNEQLLGDDAGGTARNLIGVSATDVTIIGDQALGGGSQLQADGRDEARVNYPASGGAKSIMHEGNLVALGQPLLGTIALNEAFESAEQTVAANSTVSVAHGLSSRATMVTAVLRCDSADLGYSIGDEVFLLSGQGSTANDLGISIYTPDASNVEVAFGNDAGALRIIEKGTRALSLITPANWKLVIRAWA